MPLRIALVDLYNTKKSSGRYIRAGALKEACYPVLLEHIQGKLVSFHPSGFMVGDMFFMPYTHSSAY